MKPQELRIGNIVKIDDEYLGPIEGKVTSLKESGEAELLLSVSKGNGRYFVCGSDDIFPILLTEELLTKIGFVKRIYSDKIFEYGEGMLSTVYFIESTMIDIRTEDNGATIQCTHLHQLQNAYYLVTGKELEIKA